MRSQNFLTLVVIEASREWEGMTVTADDGTMHEVAQLIDDANARSPTCSGTPTKGTLSLVLLDADFDTRSASSTG